MTMLEFQRFLKLHILKFGGSRFNICGLDHSGSEIVSSCLSIARLTYHNIMCNNNYCLAILFVCALFMFLKWLFVCVIPNGNSNSGEHDQYMPHACACSGTLQAILSTGTARLHGVHTTHTCYTGNLYMGLF